MSAPLSARGARVRSPAPSAAAARSPRRELASPRRRLFFAAPIGLGAAAVLAIGACYGATEMRIELMTDRACSGELKTAIYRGDYRRSKNPPSAVVDGCPGAAAGASAIGSVVLVPSGSRSDEATVTVVMRVDGRSPDECLVEGAAKDACILATRTFRYIEHASLMLPILLSDACRGVECGEGETCGSGGVCVGQHVTCDPDCELATTPGAGDAGLDERDAGLDERDAAPIVDAAPDGPASVCGNPGVVAAQMPPLAAAGGGKLYYVVPKDSATVLIELSLADLGNGATGQKPKTVFPTPALNVSWSDSSIISALAVTPDGMYWGIGTQEPEDGKQKVFVRGSTGRRILLDSYTSNVTSIAIPDTNDAYVASRAGAAVLQIHSDTTTTPLYGPDSPPVAANASTIYTHDGTWIYARGRDANSTPTSLDFGPGGATSGSSTIFASNGTSVFAAGNFTQKGGDGSPPPPSYWQIRRLGDALQSSPVVAAPGGEVRALAADEDFVYWVTKSAGTSNIPQIHRVSSKPPGISLNSPQTLQIDDASNLQHLAVYGACVYYWTSTSADPSGPLGPAELRASPKADFHY